MEKEDVGGLPMLVLNVVLPDPRKPFVCVVGRVGTQRMLWFVNIHPHVYYRSYYASDAPDTIRRSFDGIGQLWIDRRIGILEVKTWRARPLIGYSKPETFLRIHLVNETDRYRVQALRDSRVSESGVGLVQRFCDQTGVRPGLWVVPQGPPVAPHILDPRPPRFDGLVAVSAAGARKDLVLAPAGTATICVGYHGVCVFAPRGGRYPVALASAEDLRGERWRYLPTAEGPRGLNGTRKGGPGAHRMLSESRVVLIAIFVQHLTATSLVPQGKTQRIVLTTLSPAPIVQRDGVDISIFCTHRGAGTSHQRAHRLASPQDEVDMIIRALHIMSRVDMLVGWRLTDPFAVSSVQYLLRRLLAIRGDSVFLTPLGRRDNIRLSLRKDSGNIVGNVLPLTTLVDFLDYAKTTDTRGVPRSDFAAYFSALMMRPPRGCWRTGAQAAGDNPGACALSLCEDLMSLSDQLQLPGMTLQYARQMCVTPGQVWTRGRSYKMYCTLHDELARRPRGSRAGLEEEEEIPYVVCHARDYKLSRLEDPQDTCAGGRQIPPLYNYVPASNFTLDFASHYPRLLVGLQMGYANLINPQVAFSEGLECFSAHIGSPVAFVQTEEVMSRLPLINVLKRLLERRRVVKELLKAGGSEGASQMLVHEERAVKLLANSITGSFRSKFRHPFLCPQIGDAMCWVGRHLFDGAVSLVRDVYALHMPTYEEMSLVPIDGTRDPASYRLEVICGHTDGFDVVVKTPDGKDMVDFAAPKLAVLAQNLACLITQDLQGAHHTGFREYGSPLVTGVQLGVEALRRRSLYKDTNNMAWIDVTGALHTKGLFGLSNCALHRGAVRAALEEVLGGPAPTLDIRAHVVGFLKAFRRENGANVSALVCYGGIGESLWAARHTKGGIGGQRNPLPPLIALRQLLVDGSLAIPAVGQHVPYIHSGHVAVGVVHPEVARRRGWGANAEAYVDVLRAALLGIRGLIRG